MFGQVPAFRLKRAGKSDGHLSVNLAAVLGAYPSAIPERQVRLYVRPLRAGGPGMTPKEKYLAWKRTGNAIACRFARLMAINPTEFGQRIEVIDGTTSQALAAEIDRLVIQQIGDPAAAALTILLPDVTQLATLVEVALALAPLSGWTMNRWHEPAAPSGPVVAFTLARAVALATGKLVPSEVLALGPFAGFPATRNAPVLALEIFVGIPLPHDPKKRTPTTKANLAHVNVTPPLNQTQFANTWTKSERARLASLGGVDDCRAKAKVAFVIPLALAQSMGCA
jgi:hypothetical protein